VKLLHLLRRRRDELGATAVVVAMFFSFIALPLGAVGVDVARLYVELQRVQAAADAAATAGVTFMPDDFASARARAIEIAEDNGYPNSGTSSVVVTVGEKPTQLKVTVSSRVNNAFARTFGVPTSTMSRSAVADFNGPAPMGSPCNAFGNEAPGSSSNGPTGTAIKVPAPAICPAVPQFWGAIAGPDVDKNQGAQFETRYCGGGEDNCSGGANNDFDPKGFFYLVRVAASGVGQTVRLQVYDPAYVTTGSRCTNEPTSNPGSTTSPPSGWGGTWNPRATDARQRYWRTGTSWGGYSDTSKPNIFCTGDDPNSSLYSGTENAGVTSFALRRPVDTLVPWQGAPEPGCVRQYPGYNANQVSLEALKSDDSDYNANLAAVFHQWVDLCTFTPTQAGDYYLQVRNNVALGGTPDGNGGYAGNGTVYTQMTDNTAVRGTGTNNFGLRAVTSAPAGGISVAAYEKMRIFANSDSATTEFNLVRVPPAAANKSLVISFFDVGEGSSSGSVQVLKPTDSVNLPTYLQNCTASGVTNGSLTDCRITGITPSGYNGKYQEIRVPIPSTYSCTVSSQGGCWFRVRVSFGTGQVTDATTWTARIVGEPVRLIE
jgi:Flp pilus assembly protein TadG